MLIRLYCVECTCVNSIILRVHLKAPKLTVCQITKLSR